MSAYNRTFRIECEASRRGTLVDLRTDQMPSVIRGESAEFEISLFQNGVMTQKSNITSIAVMLVDSGGSVLVEWSLSGSDLSDSVTPGQWRRGTSHLASFVLTNSDTTALDAGTYTILVKGWLNSVPAGSSGVVFFAEGSFDLVETPEGGLPSSPPTPGPPTSWTKAESNALYAVKSTESDLNTAEADIAEIETVIAKGAATTDQKFIRGAVAQSLLSTEKTQARTNISASLAEAVQAATVAGGGTFTPNYTLYTHFEISLTGDITIANGTGVPIIGRRYIFVIKQDTTGGRKVTWGVNYSFPSKAAVDPSPFVAGLGITYFEMIYDGIASYRTIEMEPVGPPRPDIDVNAAVRMTVTGTTITPWYEWMNGLAMSVAGGTATYAMINNRAGVDLTGALHYTFAPLRLPAAVGGVSVAIVFDSRGGSTNQFLMRCVCQGVEVAYNSASGLYIAGVGASSGNRCALPFTPAEATPKIFIGTIRPSGFGGGLALDQSGNIAYASTAAMATPTAGTDYIGSNVGANYWTGRFSRLAIFMRALSWSEMIAMRRQISLEMGI